MFFVVGFPADFTDEQTELARRYYQRKKCLDFLQEVRIK